MILWVTSRERERERKRERQRQRKKEKDRQTDRQIPSMKRNREIGEHRHDKMAICFAHWRVTRNSAVVGTWKYTHTERLEVSRSLETLHATRDSRAFGRKKKKKRSPPRFSFFLFFFLWQTYNKSEQMIHHLLKFSPCFFFFFFLFPFLLVLLVFPFSARSHARLHNTYVIVFIYSRVWVCTCIAVYV